MIRNDPDRDHEQGGPDEEVGRGGEEVAGLAQPAEVADRDEDDHEDAEVHPEIDQGGEADVTCSIADAVDTATVIT